jgi:polysaccharide biosynthesis/export protein
MTGLGMTGENSKRFGGMMVAAIFAMAIAPAVARAQNAAGQTSTATATTPAAATGPQATPAPSMPEATDTMPAALANEPHSTQTPQLQTRNPRYQICNGDVIELDFPFTPEFNQTVTVQPDGYIAVRGLKEVHVEGQTVPEMTQTLQNAYKDILHEPVISVVLKEFEHPYFIVGGQVGKPGKYDLRGDTTVIQALEVAGGVNEDGKRSDVYLFRRVSSQWVETTKLDVKKMLRKGELTEDLHLRPGDMVYVPKSTYGKIKRFIPTAGMSAFLPTP